MEDEMSFYVPKELSVPKFELPSLPKYTETMKEFYANKILKRNDEIETELMPSKIEVGKMAPEIARTNLENTKESIKKAVLDNQAMQHKLDEYVARNDYYGGVDNVLKVTINAEQGLFPKRDKYGNLVRDNTGQIIFGPATAPKGSSNVSASYTSTNPVRSNNNVSSSASNSAKEQILPRVNEVVPKEENKEPMQIPDELPDKTKISPLSARIANNFKLIPQSKMGEFLQNVVSKADEKELLHFLENVDLSRFPADFGIDNFGKLLTYAYKASKPQKENYSRIFQNKDEVVRVLPQSVNENLQIFFDEAPRRVSDGSKENGYIVPNRFLNTFSKALSPHQSQRYVFNDYHWVPEDYQSKEVVYSSPELSVLQSIVKNLSPEMAKAYDQQAGYMLNEKEEVIPYADFLKNISYKGEKSNEKNLEMVKKLQSQADSNAAFYIAYYMFNKFNIDSNSNLQDLVRYAVLNPDKFEVSNLDKVPAYKVLGNKDKELARVFSEVLYGYKEDRKNKGLDNYLLAKAKNQVKTFKADKDENLVPVMTQEELRNAFIPYIDILKKRNYEKNNKKLEKKQIRVYSRVMEDIFKTYDIENLKYILSHKEFEQLPHELQKRIKSKSFMETIKK